MDLIYNVRYNSVAFIIAGRRITIAEFRNSTYLAHIV